MDSAPCTSPWLVDAVDDLERLVATSQPALRAELAPVLGRIAHMNGGTSIGDALVRPASTPFVALIDAVAADLGLAGDVRVSLLGRATVMLYAYVRLQDDLVDEPERIERTAVYGAEALLAAHLELFGAAVPSAEAFAQRSAIMRRFAEIAAAEAVDRDAVTDDSSWIGGKFLPMAVPLTGLAIAAARPELVPRLIALVQALGTALQLVNDAFNVAEDAAAGRTTPLLRWLGDEVAASRAAERPLGAVLLGHPALARLVDEAHRQVALAAALASEAGLEHTASCALRVRMNVDAAPARLLRLVFGHPVT